MKRKHANLIHIVYFLLFIYLKLFNDQVDSNYISKAIKLLDISNSYNRVNGCIIVLVKNSELNKFKNTLTQFEKSFNKKFNYPYVLLNNEKFTDEFRQEISKYTNSTIEFGLISREHWSIPKWINTRLLQRSLKTIGFNLSYRLMSRYYSGYFFRHDLTLKYEYYFRFDTDSIFPCQIDNDLFLELKQKNKLYGFAIGDHEDLSTIPTLWPSIQNWLDEEKYRKFISPNNAIKFVSNNMGKNLTSSCMFYNNFEIASFSIFRNKMYLDFFDYLDKRGGFFYERWGKFYHNFY